MAAVQIRDIGRSGVDTRQPARAVAPIELNRLEERIRS